VAWFDAGSAEPSADGEIRAVRAGDAFVAVARLDGAWRAFSDDCTHHACPLSDGWLAEGGVECPCHGSIFDVTTGAVLRGPATEPIAVFGVRLVDGRVEVAVPAPATTADSVRTKRLVCTRMQLDDLDDIRRMHTDPTVMATLGGLKTDEFTVEFVQRQVDQWERHGYGLWILRDAGDGGFVGRCGIRNVTIDGVEEVELGYGLMSEFWGRGLAADASMEALRVGFDVAGLDSVVAFTLHANARSRRVMEKCGLTYERDIVWWNTPHVLYRITAAQYRGR
jgi:[ribosomal protein S5]-alanine N-acetyltransferase